MRRIDEDPKARELGLTHARQEAEAGALLQIIKDDKVRTALPSLRRKLLLRYIDLRPQDNWAWNELADDWRNFFPPEGPASGQAAVSRDFVVERLGSGSAANAGALRCLGRFLRRGEEIHLPGREGRPFNARDLFVEAICLDPSYSEAYNSLGLTLSSTETISIPEGGPHGGGSGGGNVMTRRGSFLESIRLDPKNPRPYRNLAKCLSVVDSLPETIVLPTGEEADAEKLGSLAAALSPSSPPMFSFGPWG